MLQENGGNIEYQTYEKLEEDYVNELVHPGDLKPAVAKAINAMLDPVRKHFASGMLACRIPHPSENHQP